MPVLYHEKIPYGFSRTYPICCAASVPQELTIAKLRCIGRAFPVHRVTLPPIYPTQVSIVRLSKFLNAEEVTPYVQRANGVSAGDNGGGGGGGGLVYPEDVCISMKQGAFFWNGKSFAVSGGREELYSARWWRRRGIRVSLHRIQGARSTRQDLLLAESEVETVLDLCERCRLDKDAAIEENV